MKKFDARARQLNRAASRADAVRGAGASTGARAQRASRRAAGVGDEGDDVGSVISKRGLWRGAEAKTMFQLQRTLVRASSTSMASLFGLVRLPRGPRAACGVRLNDCLRPPSHRRVAPAVPAPAARCSHRTARRARGGRRPPSLARCSRPPASLAPAPGAARLASSALRVARRPLSTVWSPPAVRRPRARRPQAAIKTEDLVAGHLKKETVKAGSGPTPKQGQTVTAHYDGRLTNGQQFDASAKRGKPFQFRIGIGQV